MSRRWYNRDKAREMIRMAMDSAPRRHHPRAAQDEKPPWEGTVVNNGGTERNRTLSATNMVATPHSGACSLLVENSSDEISRTAGHQRCSPLSLPAPAVRDQRTLEQIRNLASETPDVMRTLLRSTKTPAMAKIRLIEIILDRAFGKAEATVNVNATTRSLEASETRIEALIRAIRVESDEG